MYHRHNQTSANEGTVGTSKYGWEPYSACVCESPSFGGSVKGLHRKLTGARTTHQITSLTLNNAIFTILCVATRSQIR